MTFWLIVGGVIAVVLLISWRHDRRRRGSVRGDIWKRSDQATGENLGKGLEAGHSPGGGANYSPYDPF